jgi:hypothetical protein
MLATIGYPGPRRSSVVLWNVNDGRPLRTIGIVDFFPTTLAFSPDGATVAIGGEGEIVHGWYKSGRIAVFGSATDDRR